MYNAKIKNIEDKLPDITNLATATVLTTVENKIPHVSNLVKKTDYNTKIRENEKKKKKITDYVYDKYNTTPEFNKRKFCCRISISKFSKQQ